MGEELEKDKPEGEEALNEVRLSVLARPRLFSRCVVIHNQLFRSIYSKANEETRRAMNKSFQTSGGTVLSTNWGEVRPSSFHPARFRGRSRSSVVA